MAAERTPVIQLTLDLMMQAIEVIKNSKYVDKTNLISVNPVRYGIKENIQLYFKMEGQQNAGSFKIRGIINQLEAYSDKIQQDNRTLITMSAGNYGRAFAYMCREMGYAGLVLIPTTAPANRVDLMRSFGVTVEPTPLEELQPTIDRYVRDLNMMYMHPFDDVNLIAGYSSIACELYNQLDHIDIILVCCGGGGLLSGIASYAKLSGRGTNTRIIGVEPANASLMHLSLKNGRPTTAPVKSIASGLAPPYVGKNNFEIVREYVEEIVLVTDEEIKDSVRVLYENGLVVEPSGAAAFAALRYGKVSNAENKKIVAILSGSNVSPSELVAMFQK